MRAVIDTCVVVDVLQSRMPFCKDAQIVFLLCANRQYEGFLTAKAVTDIYYLTHRQTHSDKTAREILTKLCALFGLLDTAALDIRRAKSDTYGYKAFDGEGNDLTDSFYELIADQATSFATGISAMG